MKTTFRLYWVSADRQASMPMGEYASAEAAWADQPAALAEILEQCPEAGTEKGDFFRQRAVNGVWEVELASVGFLPVARRRA